MPSRAFNVIVIGGGPAGSVLALSLARAGRRVVVIERGGRGRAKACGHCLGPRGASVLDDLGLCPPLIPLAGHGAAVRFHHGGTTVSAAYGDPRGRRSAALVRRHELDQWLLDAARDAGAVVLQPAVAAVEPPGDAGVRVRVTAGGRTSWLHGRAVIGADGLGSGVARALGLADRRSAGRKYGFSLDLPSAPAGAGAGDVELFVVPGGYLGIVGDDGGLHVAGLVGSAFDGPRDPLGFTRAVAARFEPLRRLGIDGLDRAAVRRLAATAPMPWRPHRVASPYGALVGDAAGYVEPFTGEGMTWGLQSGVLLAGIILAAGRSVWSADAAGAYERRHRRLVGTGHRLCRWLTGSLEHPRLSRTMFRAAARHPRLLRPVVRRVLAT